MRFPKLIHAVAATMLGLVSLPGCFIERDDGIVIIPQKTGLLTMSWSVVGAFEPQVCDFYGATHVELMVYDASGRKYKDYYAPCDAFEMTVSLPPGTYRADFTLVAPSLAAVSTTLPISTFVITENTELTIEVDFPTTSIL